MRAWLLAVVPAVGLGIAVAVAWGPSALIVYAFFLFIAVVLAVGVVVGGRLLTEGSRRRFDGRR